MRGSNARCFASMALADVHVRAPWMAASFTSFSRISYMAMRMATAVSASANSLSGAGVVRASDSGGSGSTDRPADAYASLSARVLGRGTDAAADGARSGVMGTCWDAVRANWMPSSACVCARRGVGVTRLVGAAATVTHE